MHHSLGLSSLLGTFEFSRAKAHTWSYILMTLDIPVKRIIDSYEQIIELIGLHTLPFLPGATEAVGHAEG
jgi:hypothetical protein